VASYALLFLLAGPGGLFLAMTFSPMGPWLRYWMFALLGWAVAFVLAAVLSGAVALR
jgi:hypothetical protein